MFAPPPGHTFTLLTAAAKALYDTDMGADEICKRAMTIAAEMCVYTNANFVTDALPDADAAAGGGASAGATTAATSTTSSST